jgi:hypothetical protein
VGGGGWLSCVSGRWVSACWRACGLVAGVGVDDAVSFCVGVVAKCGHHILLLSLRFELAIINIWLI